MPDPGRISVDGATRTSSPSAASTDSARSAIHTCPNAVGCTWSTITRLRAPKIAQVEQQRAALARRGLDHRVGRLDACRPRTAEVKRERDQQQPVAARRQDVEDRRVVGGERRRVPVRPAHVVDPHVQAADVVAGVRVRAAGLERRDLFEPHVACQRAVDGVRRDRPPQSPRATHSAQDCSATPH